MANNKNQLSEEGMSIDVLQSYKSLMDLYNTGLKESSCPKMRQLLHAQMEECADDQFMLFEYMTEQGMYPIENAEAQKVSEQKTKFADLQADMD